MINVSCCEINKRFYKHKSVNVGLCDEGFVEVVERKKNNINLKIYRSEIWDNFFLKQSFLLLKAAFI